MTTVQNDATADKLAEMLKENTGRSVLDSGDYYGRHWEWNQNTSFERQSEGCIEFWQRDDELGIVPILRR